MKVESLRQVFNSDVFPPELIKPCVQLLAKFEVALPVDNESILIPSQLPVLPPAVRKVEHASHWAISGCKHQRLYLMVYVPNGFWPLLITRLLSSELKMLLFIYASLSVSLSEEIVSWRLWRGGAQLLLEDIPILTLEEVAAADVLKRPDTTALSACWIDGSHWQPLSLLGPARCLHLTVLDFKERPTTVPDICGSVRGDGELDAASMTLTSAEDPHLVARQAFQAKLLAECTDAVDTLLHDWYPGMGDRESRMSNGTAYVTRCHVCPGCSSSLAAPGVLWEFLASSEQPIEALPEGCSKSFPPAKHAPADDVVSVFLLDQLIAASCSGMNAIWCHRHGPIPLGCMAPDVVCDLKS